MVFSFFDYHFGDGKYLFVAVSNYPSEGWRWECWNIPPRKAIDTFLYVAAAWLIGCALLRSSFYLFSLRRAQQKRDAVHPFVNEPG